MRIFTILLTTILFGTSCSATYFYSTINTNDPYTYKTADGIFVQEGDSLDVTYSFFGENAPITIGIVNKMSRPVYIDWRKSGVIIDSIVSPFVGRPDNIQYDEEVDFNRYMNNPQSISYIRPYSKYERQVMELANFNFDKINKDYFASQHTEADRKGRNRQLNSIQYTENESPLLMKTYLSVYEGSSQIYDPLIFESDFYISELIKGGKHSGIQSFKDKQGDIFFVRYEKGKLFKKIGESTLKVTTVAVSNITSWAVEGAIRND